MLESAKVLVEETKGGQFNAARGKGEDRCPDTYRNDGVQGARGGGLAQPRTKVSREHVHFTAASALTRGARQIGTGSTHLAGVGLLDRWAHRLRRQSRRAAGEQS